MLTGLLLTSLCALSAPPEISIQSLLPQMTSIEGLSRYPSPPFETCQASSYDRASKKPGEESWFANGDYGQYVRREKKDGRDEAVMADLTGPGAVVRFWSANPAGTVRFYFDGAATPGLEAPMADLLTGKFAPFVGAYAGNHSHGCNLYFPIPYAKSLKVTVQAPEETLRGIYYHLGYRTYRPGTHVRTFVLADATAAIAAAPNVGETLADPTRLIGARDQKSATVTIQPGRAGKLFEKKGPGEIVEIRMKANAADVVSALRGCVLVGEFDGVETIWAPLGDFFGSAPGINAYNTLPSGMTKDGEMVCRWVMPFGKSASLRINNNTDAPVSLTGSVVMSKTTFTPDRMYFHAKWRAEKMHTRPMRDWNYVTLDGRGVFVGTSLSVANPVQAWWGEGDEKIYLDGESFPSTFGTGSEDYYGYAWCSPDLFTHAYHSESRCDGPGNKGFTAVNRWHILDAMPFETSFKFDMEIWHWAECDEVYAVTVYWYAPNSTTDNFEHASRFMLTPPTIPQPKRAEGALEGEDLKVLSCTGGTHEKQDMDGSYSNEAQLWFRDGAVGDKLTLAVPVAKKGRYQVVARLCIAQDYGIVKLALNGQPLGDTMDLYNPDLSAKVVTLGTVDLDAGDNKLVVEIVGSNEKADPRHMFGLDYLLLKPAP